jgi:Skp family chaperone for outer membrane proteins
MLVLGMLTLGTAICVSSMTRAQNGVPVSGSTSRIALVNLAAVFKGYDRVKSFYEENKRYLQPMQDEAKKIVVQIEVHQKELEKKDLPENLRSQYEKNVVTYKRQLEDITNDAKSKFGKKSEEQMVIVYKEISEFVERYAVSQGYELVMHYNDVPHELPEYWNPGNINRKIQAGACIPMYMKPGIDITKNVTDLLNETYKRSVTAGGGAAMPAPQR